MICNKGNCCVSVADAKMTRNVSDVIANVWSGSDVGRILVAVMVYGFVFAIIQRNAHNFGLHLLLIVALHAMSS